MNQFADKAQNNAPLFHTARSLGLFLIFAAMVCCVLLNSNPATAWGRHPGGAVLRYLPLVLILVGFAAIACVGLPRDLLRPTAIICLLSLSLVMATGSVIALSGGASLHDSFMGRSLNILAILPGALIAAQSTLNDRLSRWLFPLVLLTAVSGTAVLLLHSFGLAFTIYPHVLHEEAIFIVAALICLCVRHTNLIFRLAVLIILLVLSVKTEKSTLALLTLVFAGTTFGRDLLSSIRGIRLSRGLARLVFIIAALLIAGTVLSFAFEIISERSQRNENDLRLRMWQSRWSLFLHSPIWGDFFTSSPLFAEPLLPDVKLPTHNDPLDLLSAGGAVALLLYVTAMLNVWLGPLLSFKWNKHIPRADSAYWIITLCYGASTLGNPVLSEPRIAVPVFFAIGHVAMANWRRKLAARKTFAPEPTGLLA